MNATAYKILAVNKNRTKMISPISFAGLAVKYEMNVWAKPDDSTQYLFVYKTIEDAKKIFALFDKRVQKHLIITECLVENFERAIGAGPVDEYRCTRLKPTRIVE